MVLTGDGQWSPSTPSDSVERADEAYLNLGVPRYRDPTLYPAIGDTRRGLLLLFVGTFLGGIPVYPVSILFTVSLLFLAASLIGAILVLIGRKAFGPAHTRSAAVASPLLLLYVIGIVVYSVDIVPSVNAAVESQSIGTILTAANRAILGSLFLAATGGLAYVLLTYRLQTRSGKVILVAGLVTGVSFWIALFFLVHVLFGEPLRGGPLDPAASGALLGLVLVALLLAILPWLLFASAFYLAWKRVNLGEIPPPARPSASPLTEWARPPTQEP